MSRNAAAAVAAELSRRGWVKLCTFSPEGEVCLNGAQLAAGLDAEERRAFGALACQAIAELFPDRVSPLEWFRQQYFNDHGLTVRADVDAVIARAGELEEAR